MSKEFKPAHPYELARQRHEMPWLWRMLHEWTFPISTKVTHVYSRRNADRNVDTQTWQKWGFHFQARDGSEERLHIMDLSPDRVKATLWDGLEFSGVLLHIGETERLYHVAVLTHLNYGRTAKFEIFRCEIHGGFGLIFPELRNTDYIK